MPTRYLAPAVGLVLALGLGQAYAAPIILTVGTDAPTLGAATTIANNDPGNTYTILLPTGTYTNDFAFVAQPMTIAASGGPVTLLANSGSLLQDKGIIVMTSSLTVKGITFQGAAIDDSLGGNGAAIRDQSGGATTLRVEDSAFISNQNGILTGGSGNQETVQIINTTFFDNGSGTGQTHALYVGDALSLLVQNSLFCGTNEGHNIKSRAANTTIRNTTSFDGAVGAGCSDAGTASYGMEFPNGGVVNISDSTLIQGGSTHNTGMIGYGAEGYPYGANTLALVNTSLSSSVAGIGIRQFGSTGSCTLTTSSSISGPTGFTPVSPETFCTVVADPPTAVNEPSMGWLLMAAALGWATVLLLQSYLNQRGREGLPAQP